MGFKSSFSHHAGNIFQYSSDSRPCTKTKDNFSLLEIDFKVVKMLWVPYSEFVQQLFVFLGCARAPCGASEPVLGQRSVAELRELLVLPGQPRNAPGASLALPRAVLAVPSGSAVPEDRHRTHHRWRAQCLVKCRPRGTCWGCIIVTQTQSTEGIYHLPTSLTEMGVSLPLSDNQCLQRFV